jgi:hypothetical protein
MRNSLDAAKRFPETGVVGVRNISAELDFAGPGALQLLPGPPSSGTKDRYRTPAPGDRDDLSQVFHFVEQTEAFRLELSRRDGTVVHF